MIQLVFEYYSTYILRWNAIETFGSADFTFASFGALYILVWLTNRIYIIWCMFNVCEFVYRIYGDLCHGWKSLGNLNCIFILGLSFCGFIRAVWGSFWLIGEAKLFTLFWSVYVLWYDFNFYTVYFNNVLFVVQAESSINSFIEFKHCFIFILNAKIKLILFFKFSFFLFSFIYVISLILNVSTISQ